MEGNRDESERCIEIAVKALAEGKLRRAKKFLNKAEKLYPSDRAKELLAKMRIPKPNRRSRKPGSATNEDHQRRNAAPPKTDSRPPEPEYTPEQLEAVKRIKKCKDAYEILMVTRRATALEIKKAYQKLALQLHPDKNKAPGSAEAFIAIRNALLILTAPGKSESKDFHDFSSRPTKENGKNNSHDRSDYYREYSNYRDYSNFYSSESSNTNNRDYKPSGSNHDYSNFYSSQSSNTNNRDYKSSSSNHDFKPNRHEHDTNDPAESLDFQAFIFQVVRFQYFSTDKEIVRRFLRRLFPLKVPHGRKYFDRLNSILQKIGSIFNIFKIISSSK